MKSEKDNLILCKSRAFALRSVKVHKHLKEEHHEYILSTQYLRSATSIGANVSEGPYGQTKADFASKMSLALREARETKYWIELLNGGEYITTVEFQSLLSDCEDIIRILTSICKSCFDDLGCRSSRK